MMKRVSRRLRAAVATRLGKWLHEAEAHVAAATLPKFANSPRNLRIDLPRRIVNPASISIGDDVYLGPGSLLMGISRYPGPELVPPPGTSAQAFSPRISLGNRVSSTGGLQVSAMLEIAIEDDVLFATNVNLTDGLHGYADARLPYKYQALWKMAPIRIGRGCWIGQNVVVLPGVSIGEYSIIGANSVVTRSVPAKTIAVGAPARVIRRWDEEAQVWNSV